MSRAINLTVGAPEVTAMCGRHNIDISAIEQLPDGGTRVVLMNADDTAVIARAFKSRIIQGAVQRTPFAARQR